MKRRIQPSLYPSFFFLIFVFLFLWFSRIHPLIPFDADDWTYLYSPGCTDLGCVESLQSISGSGSSLLFESRIVPGYAFDRGLYHSANSDARFRRQRFHHSLSGMLRLPSAPLLPHFPPHRVAAHSTFFDFSLFGYAKGGIGESVPAVLREPDLLLLLSAAFPDQCLPGHVPDEQQSNGFLP